jgi:pilus assembly protein TadC
MVHTAKSFSDAEVLAMQDEARRPLVSIASVFLAFFLPPTVVGLVFVAATTVGIPLSAPVAAAAILLAIVPPAYSMVATLRRSERRNEILSELSKYQESLRARPRSP